MTGPDQESSYTNTASVEVADMAASASAGDSTVPN